MFEDLEFMRIEFWNNTVQDYLISLAIFFGSMVILTILNQQVIHRLKKLAEKSTNELDDFVIQVFNRSIVPVLYVASLYIALKQLTLPTELDRAIDIGFKIILIVQFIRLILAILLHFIEMSWRKTEGGMGTATRTIVGVIRVIIWGVAIVFILDNLGFDVNSVIAGLGIGGVAVALAAQTILGDLFNYFVIFFDKPFKDGDFIIIDEHLGVIEHIGIKSTRIRSLGGEQLIFSNSDLTSSRVKNYKRMERRRVLFTVGAVYQTKLAQMKKVPEMIKEIINGIEDTIFDRTHFKGFGDFSLDIEVVYHVIGGDYNKYMDIQEKINLKIMEAFEKEGIEFAYPTQTLFVNKS